MQCPDGAGVHTLWTTAPPVPLCARGKPCPIRRPGAYRDGMSDLSGLDDGETLSTVELETDDGRECLIYGPGPEFALVGEVFIPMALLDEEQP